MEHDCEFFLITNVAVYACECDPHHIEIDGQEYVPIEKLQSLQKEVDLLRKQLTLLNEKRD
jgi:hypothetical protein